VSLLSGSGVTVSLDNPHAIAGVDATWATPYFPSVLEPEASNYMERDV